MVDWLSLSLSITALAMSTITAIVGLILNWVDHQREYDPMIVLGTFKNEEDSHRSDVLLKNLGRGSAFDIRVNIYDKEKKHYRAYSIDLLPSNEAEPIPYEILDFETKKRIDPYTLFENNFTLLFHITYENENGRKKQKYYIGETIPKWYSKITKNEFNKYLKKGLKY